MPRVPTPYDTAAPTVEVPRSTAQIDERVAQRIGSSGHQIGNAIASIGAAFGEIGNRQAAVADQTAEGRAKLDWYKFDNEAWDGLKSNAKEDGSGWDNAGSIYDKGRQDILNKYPIADPKRREALNLFMEHQVAERGFRAGREKLAAQKQYNIGIEDKEIEGAAASVEANPNQEMVDAKRSALHSLVDGGRGIYHNDAAIEARKRAIESALVMGQWRGLMKTDPDAAMELRQKILGGQYQIDQPAATPGPQSSAGDAKSYLKTRLAPGYESRTSDIENLHPVTQDRLAAFVQAGQEAGYDISVISGHRSNERQAVLWQQALNKYGSADEARKYVAPPGKSTHQTGEAVDLQYGDRKAGLGGTETPSVKWAHANAEKFGLTFPLGHEDWHIEPNEARAGKNYDASKTYYKGGAASNDGGITPKLTAYSPQAGGDLAKMEGGYAAAKPGPDGKAEVRTLEDFAAGKSPYITIAGDPDQNGKKYTIPRIEWIDSSGKQQVSENVPAVVHDTGSAFKGVGTSKFDIAVAHDMTNAQMNAQPFLKGGVKLVEDGGGKKPPVPMGERGIAGFSRGGNGTQVASLGNDAPASVNGHTAAAEPQASPYAGRIAEIAQSKPDTKISEVFKPDEIAALTKQYPAIGEIVGSEAVGQLSVGDIAGLVKSSTVKGIASGGNPADDPIARIRAVAGDQPNTALTDVFDEAKLAELAKKFPAIANIGDLQGATVGDAIKIFDAFDAARAQEASAAKDRERIAGRLVPGQTFTVNSKNGPVSISADAVNALDRKTIQEMSGLTVEAQKVRTAEQAAIASDMMRKQLANVETTGKDHSAFNDQALTAALAKNPKALANFRHKVEIARTVYKATDNAVNLPNETLDDRIRVLDQSVLDAAGDVDPDTQAAFARASKRVEALKTAREKDPARAVAGSTEVKAVLDTIPGGEPKNKSHMFQIADATMKAQARLGIAQIPITQSQGKLYMSDIINAPEAKKNAVALETARKLNDTYGSLAPQVMAAAAKFAHGDSQDDRDRLDLAAKRVARESSMSNVDKAIGNKPEEKSSWWGSLFGSGKSDKRQDQLPPNQFLKFGDPR